MHECWVNKEKKWVKCKHCGEEMSGLQLLKCHLGGVGSDATPCEQAASTVREMFRDVATKEKHNLRSAKSRSVGEVQLVNAHKRGRSQDSSRESDTPSAVESLGFREMMIAASDGTVPDSNDLKGRMFQEALEEVEEYVKKVKESWAITGCSILLEAWVDSKGRDLVTFLADSPAGPVYLTSLDVSDIKQDSKALISLVDGLVDEVGVQNVVQIVACSASGWVGELGESYAGNKKGVFWSVSVSHCFELMLLKIGELDSLGYIVDTVNVITDYINNNPLVLKLVRDQDHSLTVSSEFEFFLPYLTLESIFRAKNELTAMLASSDCNNEEDVRISKLVNDLTFWKTVGKLDMYRVGEECFNEASQADHIIGISPAEWWAQKASQHPELQSFAIKVLSQTCEGASRYKLQSRLAEKLVPSEGMTSCEQERLEDLAFVHYNLHLKSCKAKLSEEQ
ncbi:hypothetical protein HID58_011273 [Brassica napus]|uniref:DUF659 domain-containing protein n=1 Tax=Brassica napus TaxID=3708 RepID=A0ABQ8DXQ4_BRANA|nr:hypothetical protein HID58_011273 [Brassica napus]